MSNDSDYTVSSGNVFADLEIAELEEALVKAELASRISEILEDRHLTPAEAARLLGIDRSKVSALVRGRLTGFSTERLFAFLNVLDRDVEIAISVKPASRERARVRVLPDRAASGDLLGTEAGWGRGGWPWACWMARRG